jgi:hypothetical protein
MDDIPIFGRVSERAMVNDFMAHYGAPAYVRRANQVQEALDLLLHRCRRQRTEWLKLARTRLGVLRALAGDWTALRPLLADDEQARTLEELHADLQPRLRVPVGRTTSARKLRRALRELVESIEYFNRRWREFVPTVDVSRVNELRDGYNRYYLLEKECAMRSARLARQGFVRLEPLTTEGLTALLPPLPVPRLA